MQITPDGKKILVSAKDKIYLFARCAVSPAGSQGDCNANGQLDICDLSKGVAKDCNGDGVLDSCDISKGTSTDCDKNKIPDDCPVCPPVEAVFVMDHSSSMDGEAKALCSKITTIDKILAGKGIKFTATLLGIAAAPGGAYSCLTSSVIKTFGTVVPGSPPVNQTTLGKCPGGIEVPSEDWGRAVSVVAGTKKWGSNTVRMVIPIADEGPWCGVGGAQAACGGPGA